MLDDRDSQRTDDPVRHGLAEDIQAIVVGTLLAALGTEFFRQAHLATGGTAGMSFLIHYVSDWGIGQVLFVLNLPFYAFGWVTLGKEFTFKTFGAVALFAVESMLLSKVFAIGMSNPWYSAVMGGLLVGIGLLILLRHRSSLGGIGILAAFVQERFGWRAGKFQLGMDCVILAAAFLVLDWHLVALSVVGAVVLNMVLAVNHKPGRYNGY
jgi:uncharacterized membrane-anchored protein YitT (DUF2179 family)